MKNAKDPLTKPTTPSTIARMSSLAMQFPPFFLDPVILGHLAWESGMGLTGSQFHVACTGTNSCGYASLVRVTAHHWCDACHGILCGLVKL
jgi:hypothetical protein